MCKFLFIFFLVCLFCLAYSNDPEDNFTSHLNKVFKEELDRLDYGQNAMEEFQPYYDIEPEHKKTKTLPTFAGLNIGSGEGVSGVKNDELTTLKQSCFCGKLKHNPRTRRYTIPWMASLADMNGNHFCGATIINQDHILTSSSCATRFSPNNIRVQIGSSNLEATFISNYYYLGEKIDVLGDLAILKIIPAGRYDPLSKFIKGKLEPACFNFEEKKYEFYFMLPGWNQQDSYLRVSFAADFRKDYDLNNYYNMDQASFMKFIEDYKNMFIFTSSQHSYNKHEPSDEYAGGPLLYELNEITTVEGVISSKMKLDQGKHSSYSLAIYKQWFDQILGYNYCNPNDALGNN